MKRFWFGAVCLSALLLFIGCAPLPPPQALHPPGWIHGEWSDEFGVISYTFSATTVIQSSGNISIDLGELYLTTEASVTETITSTLYSYTVPVETGFVTMEFSNVDGNTINMTMRTNIVTIGPAPLYRQ